MLFCQLIRLNLYGIVKSCLFMERPENIFHIDTTLLPFLLTVLYRIYSMNLHPSKSQFKSYLFKLDSV